MTTRWAGEELAAAINAFSEGAAVDFNATDVWLRPDSVRTVCQGLRDRPEFKFDLLSAVTAVDYIDHFEMVYHITSLIKNRTAVLKSKCGWGRKDPEVPSVTPVWRGAELQEREVWDLMGVRFEGHPNHKRIMLWEGFPGHPLRKDFLTYAQSIVPVENRP